jgi:hypothetical protein
MVRIIIFVFIPIVFAGLGVMHPSPSPEARPMFIVVSIIYAVLGLFLVVMNICIVMHNRRGGKYSSTAPFFGGFLLATAILAQPIVILKYFFWVAFIIDFTWIFLFPHFCYYVLLPEIFGYEQPEYVVPKKENVDLKPTTDEE